jgi:hypothetical protein
MSETPSMMLMIPRLRRRPLYTFFTDLTAMVPKTIEVGMSRKALKSVREIHLGLFLKRQTGVVLAIGIQRLLEGLSHITEWTAREVAPDRQNNARVGFVGWIDFSDNQVNSRCLKSARVDLTRLVQTRCS